MVPVDVGVLAKSAAAVVIVPPDSLLLTPAVTPYAVPSVPEATLYSAVPFRPIRVALERLAVLPVLIDCVPKKLPVEAEPGEVVVVCKFATSVPEVALLVEAVEKIFPLDWAAPLVTITPPVPPRVRFMF